MTEDATPEEGVTAEPTSQRPAAHFSGSGGISIAVWKNKTDSGRDSYSVRIDRSYKDANGNYQSTPYLRDGDLLRAQKLLEQVDEWIEQDKGRQRPQSAGLGR